MKTAAAAPQRPDLHDVLLARRTIAPHLARTPLVSYPMLDALLGARAWVKREDAQPTSAFKVRGGINLVANLDAAGRASGICSASTGNHGQSVAYAAQRFGVRCVVVVPETANAGKIAAIRAYGADVRLHGRDFDEARAHVEDLSRTEGLRYVHSGNEPLLIAGVGTYTLEILEDVPDVDFVFVPLGGGSGAAGAALVAKAIRPRVRVIAVQSAQAPAAAQSWRNKRVERAPIGTIAEGLQTGVGFELPQSILWDLLDDCVLVDDAEIEAAVGAYVEHAHLVAEHAGAAPLAAALRMRDAIAGRKVALVVSGANITRAQLATCLARA